MVPRPRNVRAPWQPLFYCVVGAMFTLISFYICKRVYVIMLHGQSVVVSRGSFFGYLPNLMFCGSGSNVEYGHYRLKLWNGFELGNRVSEVDVRVEYINTTEVIWKQQMCLVFDMSSIKLPRFSEILAAYPEQPAEPALSLMVLHRIYNHSQLQLQGLELFATHHKVQQLVGQVQPFGGVAPTSYRSGEVREFTLEMRKKKVRWFATEDLLSWQGLRSGFDKTAERFHFTRGVVKHFLHVPCEPGAWTSKALGFFFADGNRFGNATGGCLAQHCDGVDGPCAPGWQLTYVTFVFQEEGYGMTTRQGATVQVLELLSSLGGFLSIGTCILTVLFIRVNGTHEVSMVHDEVAFIGERCCCRGEGSSEEHGSCSDDHDSEGMHEDDDDPEGHQMNPSADEMATPLTLSRAVTR